MFRYTIFRGVRSEIIVNAGQIKAFVIPLHNDCALSLFIDEFRQAFCLVTSLLRLSTARIG